MKKKWNFNFKIKKDLKYNFKSLLMIASLGLVFLILIGSLILWRISVSLPPLYKIEDYKPRLVSKVYAKNNKDEPYLIGEFFLEKRTLIPFENIPKYLVNAFIAAEDDSFYQHKGINLTAITRAAIANFKAGQVVQGGSTITQQVAKTLFLTSERSLLRKLREAILSKRLESYLKKEEILYLYLNQIYLGNGAYGVQEASESFFRKKIENIDLAEAALLAGLTRAPSAFNPLQNPKRAKERQIYVLKRMKEVGFITEEEFKNAEKKELKIFQMRKAVLNEAQYFVEHLRIDLVQKYGEKMVYEEGLHVYTPTRWELLVSSYQALRQGVKDVDKRRGYRGPIEKLNADKISLWLENSKKELVKEILGYRYLVSDGSLREPFSEIAILPGKTYKGIVKKIEDKEKYAIIQVADIDIKISKEGYLWAKPVQVNNKKPVSQPDKPSDVFDLNDVVLVNVEKQDAQGQFTGVLDQEPLLEGALVSMEVDTGRILALQGGFNFERSEFNRVYQAQRQVGSAMKPILYSCGIENGLTPLTTLVDMPLSYETEEYGRWRPENYDNKFEGEISARSAFAKSRNPPAVHLVGELGLKKVLDFARRLGWKSPLNEDLSSALGSSSETLMNMTEIYSIFPRLGRKIFPLTVDKVFNAQSIIIEESTPDLVPQKLKTSILNLKDLTNEESEVPEQVEKDSEANPVTEEGTITQTTTEKDKTKELLKLLPRSFPLEEDTAQVLDPRVAYITNTLMREAVIFGTGSKANELRKVVGGKTGTTNDYKDAWFIGYSPHVITGVWVGYDDPSVSLGEKETGGMAALPIWVRYMKDALANYPEEDFPVPPGIKLVPIHKDTEAVFRGQLNPENKNVIHAAFIDGTEPSQNEGRVQSKPTGTRGEFLKEDFE